MSSDSDLFTAMLTTDELDGASIWVNDPYQGPQAPLDEICKEIGRAITAWAMVERHLWSIFSMSSQSASPLTSLATWEALESIRARLEMTDRVHFASNVAGYNAGTWGALKSRCQSAAKLRNQITHGQLYVDHRADTQPMKLFIASRNTAQRISSRHYAHDIRRSTEAFHQLAADLEAYHLALMEASERLSTSPRSASHDKLPAGCNIPLA